jgi:hypothetical protein
MNKAEKIIKQVDEYTKTLSQDDLNEIDNDLEEIVSITKRIDQAYPNNLSGKILELVGGIQYLLGLRGSGRV